MIPLAPVHGKPRRWTGKDSVAAVGVLCAVSVVSAAVFDVLADEFDGCAAAASGEVGLRPCVGGQPHQSGKVRLLGMRFRGKRRSGRRDQHNQGGTRPLRL